MIGKNFKTSRRKNGKKDGDRIKCRFCGFRVNYKERPTGDGTGVTISNNDFSVTGGCPFCGSMDYK